MRQDGESGAQPDKGTPDVPLNQHSVHQGYPSHSDFQNEFDLPEVERLGPSPGRVGAPPLTLPFPPGTLQVRCQRGTESQAGQEPEAK